MRCELCKKRKATIYLTQGFMPEKSMRVDLCEKCARVNGYDENDLSRMFELLDKKISSYLNAATFSNPAQKKRQQCN